MATIGSTYLNLADAYKRSEPDGSASVIIEMLAQMNPILEDAITVEANLGTKHMTTVRTGLPSGTWRKLYQGVQPSKSTTAQVEDATGMYEAWSEIDSKLVEIWGAKGNDLRLSEAMGFLEGMANDMATSLFYDNTDTKPEGFLGLAPRFNALSSDPTKSGFQVVDWAGTSGGNDQTSIWFITWGERTCHLLYPKGSKAGISREDKGKQTRQNSDGSLYDVHREKFSWDVGLSVRDHRYIARVANIDTSAITATDDTLIPSMIKAYYKLWNRSSRLPAGRTVIYCNRTIMEWLHIQARDFAKGYISVTETEGVPIMRFLGLPIRECDAITNTEAIVS